MVVIRVNLPETEPVAFATAARLALALLVLSAAPAARAVDEAAEETGFAPVYALLQTHCGACHVRGGADGPWSLNTPPSTERFGECLAEPQDSALECATYHELVDSPGPGIPAWVRPEEAAASEPYAEACNPEVSFHIGHSLPQKVPDADCARFLHWIETGARR